MYVSNYDDIFHDLELHDSEIVAPPSESKVIIVHIYHCIMIDNSMSSWELRSVKIR